jgi:hypothetical protein
MYRDSPAQDGRTQRKRPRPVIFLRLFRLGLFLFSLVLTSTCGRALQHRRIRRSGFRPGGGGRGSLGGQNRLGLPRARSFLRAAIRRRNGRFRSLDRVPGRATARVLLYSRSGPVPVRDGGIRFTSVIPAQLIGLVFVDRAGVGDFFGDPELVQFVDDLARLHFQLPRQFIDSNLTHN